MFALYRRTVLVAYAHIFPPEDYPFPDAPVREQWRAIVERHGRDAQVVVAEVSGEVVGAVLGTPETLENLFVVREQWGTGVANLLDDAALEVSRRAGSTSCRLEVLEANHRGRRFYECLSWREDGRRRMGEYPPHPALVGYSITLS